MSRLWSTHFDLTKALAVACETKLESAEEEAEVAAAPLACFPCQDFDRDMRTLKRRMMTSCISRRLLLTLQQLLAL